MKHKARNPKGNPISEKGGKNIWNSLATCNKVQPEVSTGVQKFNRDMQTGVIKHLSLSKSLTKIKFN